jgi:hypothetical protein
MAIMTLIVRFQALVAAIVFFDKTGNEIIRKDAYFKQYHLHSIMDYVLTGAYKTQPNFQRYLLVCPECAYEFSANDLDEQARIIKDANGNVLKDGDSVSVIKDLKIKGTQSVVRCIFQAVSLTQYYGLCFDRCIQNSVKLSALY